MTQFLIQFFSGLPGPLATGIIGMLPVAESRVAVPVAITVYGIHPVLAVLYAAMGDLIPVLILINLLGPVSGWLIRKLPWTKRFFDWLFAHTRHKFVGKYEKYGVLALALFVAIPIPGTGSWAGSVASFVFGIPKAKAFGAIAVGVLIAASIVALVTTGVVSFLDWAVH